MALQNLGDLKASIVDWMFDRPDLATVSGDFVQLTHADLNRVLRTRRQIKTETLPLDENASANLPDDYLQYREVVALTNPIRVLEATVPTYQDWAYPFQQADWPAYFVVDGPTLTVRPKTTAKIRIEYWAKLPDLVNETDTNWLLQETPGIYLYGCLKHACLYIGDKARAADMAAMQSGLIDALIKDDRMGMYSRVRARASRRGP